MKEYCLGNILRGNGETFFYEKKFTEPELKRKVSGKDGASRIK